MSGSVRGRVAVCLGLLAGCKSGPPTLPPNPPAQAPQGLDLAPERILRGSAAATGQGVDTDRPEGVVRSAVLRHREAIRGCYERVLPASPDAAGRIDLGFVVEVNGNVFDATAETDAQSLRPARECILAIIRPLRIEGVRQPLRVTFPIQFENTPLELNVPEVVLFPRMRVPAAESVAALVRAGSGNLTADEAAAVLSLRTAEHLNCYAPLLRERATRRAEGSARFSLAVNPDGTVGEVFLGPLDEPVRATGECHMNLLRGAQMRATGRRATISVTFAMRPQEEPTPAPAPRR